MEPTNNLNVILSNLHLLKTFTKRDIEIVITHYNESLDWTRDLAHLCTVYQKGEQRPPEWISEESIVKVPNFGVGVETVLRHCIERYHSLATVTYFCQATLADREDQPLIPFTKILLPPDPNCLRGHAVEAWDLPSSKYVLRVSNPNCASTLTLGKFRKKINIPYKPYYEKWVRGDWICVGKNTIRKRSLDYYKKIYSICSFERGVWTEECWFMERSFYSIFN